MSRSSALRAPFGALFGPKSSDARQSLVALSIGLVASLVAGLTLGAISDTLEELPGLLVLVPAAIGLRGTIFGALGARLGTSIHTGTFGLSARADTVLGQNVLASGVLTLVTSVVLAFLAKGVAVGFGLDGTISVVDFLVISLVGGLVSSAVVMVLTVSLAANSVRHSWDLDNVMAPLVTAAGDMVTLPSLFLATFLVGFDIVTPLIAVVGVIAAAAVLALALRSSFEVLKRILVESLPIVVIAGSLSLIAGITLEGQLSSLTDYPALLALVPPFLASAGAIGGILSSRLTSKLHLGVIEPTPVPGRGARSDLLTSYAVAVPVFAASSVVADLAAWLIDLDSPGPFVMVVVAVVGGLLATTLSLAIAYYGAIVSYRLGLDPDNIGIPLVTSSIDLLGSISFILAVTAFVST
jgi:mgtE-like transporter